MMPKFRYSVKIPENLNFSNEILAKEVTMAMKDAVGIIEFGAKSFSPVKTGTLARSISSVVAPLSGSVKGYVSASASYARYVEEGTGLFGPQHQLIKPKNAKSLAWKGSGGMVFAKSSKGMKPRKFMRMAYYYTRQRVETRFKEAIASAIEQISK